LHLHQCRLVSLITASAEFLLIFNFIASVGIFYFASKWLWETVNGSIVKYEKEI
jgi:hypothetical protein